jgi:hypothetical protein
MLPALLVCRGVWSVEELEKFEEGVARWGLSSPDAIIALLPSRPPYFGPPTHFLFYFNPNSMFGQILACALNAPPCAFTNRHFALG